MNHTLAIKDIKNSIVKWRIWYYLSVFDIKSKYQRTKLGPIWIVLVNLIFISGISLVWSNVLHTDIQSVLPRFFSGFIIWQFMSSFVLEGSELYVFEKRLIHNIPIEKFLFQIKNSVTQLIIFLHNLLGFFIVMLFLGKIPNWHTLLVIPNLILTAVCGIATSTILSIVVCRFRDFSPLIKSLMSVGMLVTPVLWDASQFGNKYYLVYINPFAIFLDLLRKPMLGEPMGMLEVSLGIMVTFVVCIFSYALFARFRNRIVYWI